MTIISFSLLQFRVRRCARRLRITGGRCIRSERSESPRSVIIRDGLIEAAARISRSDHTDDESTSSSGRGPFYPRLIDAQLPSDFHRQRRAARSRGRRQHEPRSRRRRPSRDVSRLHRRARDQLSDDDAEAKRATGVTTIVSVRRSAFSTEVSRTECRRRRDGVF